MQQSGKPVGLDIRNEQVGGAANPFLHKKISGNF